MRLEIYRIQKCSAIVLISRPSCGWIKLSFARIWRMVLEKQVWKDDIQNKVVTINWIANLWGKTVQSMKGMVSIDLGNSKSLLSNTWAYPGYGKAAMVPALFLNLGAEGCHRWLHALNGLSTMLAKVKCSPFISSFTHPPPLDSCCLRCGLWSSSKAIL